MRSSGSICGWLATGSETSMPRLIMGAVTMKTRSSTSTTSTSGVTLISPEHGGPAPRAQAAVGGRRMAGRRRSPFPPACMP